MERHRADRLPEPRARAGHPDDPRRRATFPIIRFDAAMTGQAPVQRLWFPEPGSGGAIPSRAEHGACRARSTPRCRRSSGRVVDRAREAPGRAARQAFWLMEATSCARSACTASTTARYEHAARRAELNYRRSSRTRSVRSRDPAALRQLREQPDERTAVDQFGRGEKYFGTCVAARDAAANDRPRPDRRLRGEVRDGVPPRAASSSNRSRHGERALAPHLAAAAPALGVLGRERLPALRLLERPRRRERGRVRVLEPRRRHARARAVPQPLGRRARLDPHVGVVRRQARRRLAPAGAPDDRQVVRLRSATRAVRALPRPVSGLEFLHRTRDVVERGIRVELAGFGSRVLLDWRRCRGRPPVGRAVQRAAGQARRASTSACSSTSSRRCISRWRRCPGARPRARPPRITTFARVPQRRRRAAQDGLRGTPAHAAARRARWFATRPSAPLASLDAPIWAGARNEAVNGLAHVRRAAARERARRRPQSGRRTSPRVSAAARHAAPNG